jgi:hypothetical protein
MEDNRIPLKIYIGDDVVRRTSLPQGKAQFERIYPKNAKRSLDSTS